MTNNEKYLLTFLGGVLIIAVYWFLIYSPLQEETRMLKSEVQEMNEELDYVTLEYMNKDVYLNDIEYANKYIEKINSQFPAGITQEDIIYIMKDLETTVDSLNIQAYTLGEPEVIVQDNMEETSEEEHYEQVIKIPVNVSFNTTYNDYKKVLEYIEKYPNQLSIEQMDVTSDVANSEVLSSFNILFYALESSEREYLPTDHFGPYEPKSDAIFQPFETLGINYDAGVAQGETREPDDIVLGVTSINSSLPTVSIYQANNENSTKITADNPNYEGVEIHVNQIEGDYYYRYKTSGRTYPEDYTSGRLFNPGNTIDIKAISSQRYNDADTSGVNVILINETDIPMNVRVEYEDANRPRLNIVEQRGDISIN